MHSKLTLRLGEDLIAQAKKEARNTGRSLSKMVGDYFRSVTGRIRPSGHPMPVTPLVASLKGSLEGHRIDRKDYRRHLERKYL